MKWNWGTGIVVVMLAFMSFILFFVVKMSTDKNHQHDLVTDEYYAEEIVYQEKIDAENNANNLKEKIISKKTNDGWLITFPKEIDASKIDGKVLFYRPSNKKLDFEMPIILSNSSLLIPKNKMIEGRWNIILEWKYDGKNFLNKKSIVY